MMRLIRLIADLFKGGAPKNDVPAGSVKPAIKPNKQPVFVSGNCLEVLKYFESCELDAYWDADGKVWTIGWGDTGPNVVKGLRITQQGADIRLENRLKNEFVPGVLRALVDPAAVKQEHLDAMVDLAYNIGVDAFRGSTLCRKYNAGDFDGAASEFKRWNRSGGRVLLGLKRRRAADEALFRGANGKDAIRIGAAIV